MYKLFSMHSNFQKQSLSAYLDFNKYFLFFLSMKNIIIIIIIIIMSLGGCLSKTKSKSSSVDTEELNGKKLLPLGAIPIEWKGEAIFYDLILFDSIKVKVIIDSGVESFFVDSAYINNHKIGISMRNEQGVIGMVGSFWGGGMRIYPSDVDRNAASPLLENLPIWIANLNKNLGISTESGVAGLFPLKALAKKIIEINLKDQYLLPMDSVNEEGYIKIPLLTIDYSGIPYVSLNLRFEKDGVPYIIDGTFLVDYGFGGSIGLQVKKMENTIYTRNKQRRDTVTMQFNNIILEHTAISIERLQDSLAGVLGVQFLSRFNVVIDYKRKYLYLKLHQ